MSYLRSWAARILGLFGRRSADDELREELETHLEMETEENIRRGMAPAEARRQALLASGGVTQAAEAVREQRGLPWLEQATTDVRYAVRALRHSPWFTAVVVLTLALGIGANTAIFSVVRGVLLKPLPNSDGDRLVYLQHSMDGPGGRNILFSVPEVQDLRAGAPAFDGIAESCPWTVTLQGRDAAVHIDVGLVTGNYFEVMGLSPILGRLTRSTDDGPGVPPVMVLTHAFWMKRFGGDSSIIGRQVRIDDNSVTVIGVVQPAPFFPLRVDALLNMVVSKHHLSAQMILGRTHRMTEVIARLAPGATLDRARAEVATVDARIQREFADAYDPASHYRVAVVPFKTAIGQNAQLTLLLLMAAAAFVMIISAASVANLTLMRGVRREPEMVTRAALGSGLARLRRLLLAENLALTLTGAVLGVVFSLAGLRLLVALAARYSVRANEVRLDGTVLGFTVLLAVAVALLLSFVGVLPREGSLASLASAGSRRASGSQRTQRLQRGLVIAQVAVSVVLLAGAGLLTRTMIRLSEVKTGLTTDEMLAMEVQLLSLGSGDFQRIAAADPLAKDGYSRMEHHMRALPGVEDVGVGSTMPLFPSGVAFEVKVEGRALEAGEAVPHASMRTADPDYFKAAGIPLLAGRGFDATDQMSAPKVVILNKVLADKLFHHEDPLGRRVAWSGDVLRFTPISGEWRSVVGVVGDTRDGGLDAATIPVMYEPFAQELAMGGAVVIRADSNVEALAPAATRIVRTIAPTTPIDRVMTVAQIRDQSVAPRRLNAQLLSMFGILAMIVAAVGIAGVLAFSVSARTNEIGIRMSLGADGSRVQRMILREGGTLLAAGLLLGVAGAWLGAGLMRGLLFGVAPHDPATFIGVTVAMAAVGLGACWIPALRAARVDPSTAMRAL